MSKQPILIVEDETVLAMDIEHILVSGGYHVAGIAADRQEALAAAKHAAIAFVDINLRDGATGPLIAQELAEHHGMTIVYVTANPAQIQPRAPRAIGAVRKPFRDHTILHAAALATNITRRLEALPSEIVLF